MNGTAQLLQHDIQGGVLGKLDHEHAGLHSDVAGVGGTYRRYNTHFRGLKTGWPFWHPFVYLANVCVYVCARACVCRYTVCVSVSLYMCACMSGGQRITLGCYKRAGWIGYSEPVSVSPE